MAKLGSVLERQLKKLGIEITDSLKSLTVIDVEVPDELAKKIDQGLLTIDAAKSNPEVTKVVKQATLAGADSRMNDIIKEMGLDAGEDFVNEKNTYEKITMLSKMIHQDGQKKGEGNSKEDWSEILRKEREAFNKKDTEMQKRLKEAVDLRANDQTDLALHKKLLSKNYALPKDMDLDLKVSTAKSIVANELKAIGAVAKVNAAGDLVITDKDGNKAYTDKHEAIDDVDSFFDSVLTRKKLLNTAGSHQEQNNQRSSGPLLHNGKNAGILNEIDAQLKGMA